LNHLLLLLLLLGLIFRLFLSCGGGAPLHFHHDFLLFDCLWVGRDTSQLSNPLLFDLSLPILHLFDKDLGMKVIRLNLTDELLMSSVLLLWNLWVLFLW